MNKQLIIIGIIVLLVVVLSGCVEQTNTEQNNNELSEISLKDISEHANKYINQTVIVRGEYWRSYNATVYRIYDIIPDGISMLAKETNDITKPALFVLHSQYKFTGIVRYGELPSLSIGSELYLEVSKIEAT